MNSGAGQFRSGSDSEELDPASNCSRLSESSEEAPLGGVGPQPGGRGLSEPAGGSSKLGSNSDDGGAGRGSGTLHALRRAIWAAQSVADECGVRRGLGVLVRALLRELGRVQDEGLRLRATSLFVDSCLFAAGPGESETLVDASIVGGTEAGSAGSLGVLGANGEQAAGVNSEGPIPRQQRLLEILLSLAEAGVFPCLLFFSCLLVFCRGALASEYRRVGWLREAQCIHIHAERRTPGAYSSGRFLSFRLASPGISNDARMTG
jgi:hypothetical protein